MYGEMSEREGCQSQLTQEIGGSVPCSRGVLKYSVTSKTAVFKKYNNISISTIID